MHDEIFYRHDRREYVSLSMIINLTQHYTCYKAKAIRLNYMYNYVLLKDESNLASCKRLNITG